PMRLSRIEVDRHRCFWRFRTRDGVVPVLRTRNCSNGRLCGCWKNAQPLSDLTECGRERSLPACSTRLSRYLTEDNGLLNSKYVAQKTKAQALSAGIANVLGLH